MRHGDRHLDPRQAFDWSKLPFFLGVARAGSLRLAAEALGTTHATVDRNLKGLEEAYGVRLFDRSKAGLTLTPAGEALLPLAEAAEMSVIAARRRLEGLDMEATGHVRLSLPTGLTTNVIPGILARFERTYPDIELSVTTTNKFEDITRAETDVSLRIAFQVDDDVVGRKLLTYNSGIFASPDYLERCFADAGPKGEGLQWVGWGDTAVLPQWLKDSPFPRARIRYKLRSPTLITRMVEEGAGMSYLPCWLAHYSGRLVQVPGTGVSPDRSIWILLHSDLRKTTRVRLLVDHLAEEFRKLRPIFEGSGRPE